MVQKRVLVLVTGGTGFVASHIIEALLERGFAVRATVRDPGDHKRCCHLLRLQSQGCPLEIVRADLTQAEDWPPAIKGCVFVIHVACPALLYHFEDGGGEEDGQCIERTVQGTLTVLRAAAAGGVKRVVLTGSLGNSASTREEVLASRERPIDETSWAKTEEGGGLQGYHRAKILAERAAWDFIRGPEAHGMELVVMCPAVCVGPTLNQNLSESLASVTRPLSGGLPLVPDVELPAVDVRDVGRAHALAIERHEAAGQRYILFCESLRYIELVRHIAPRFRRLGYRVSTVPLPNWLARAVARVKRDVRLVRPALGVAWHVDADKSRSHLGLEYNDVRKAFLDMAVSAVEMGLVRRTPKYTRHAKAVLSDAKVPALSSDGSGRMRMSELNTSRSSSSSTSSATPSSQ